MTEMRQLIFAEKRMKISEDTRLLVLFRDHSRCRVCGVKDKSVGGRQVLHLHHIIPAREGGLSVAENLITLCHKFHSNLEPRAMKYVSDYTTIQINEETRRMLFGLGKKGDSYDDIIKSLLEAIKK